ncbi:uncharacterized protein LOC132723290 [Ruditapes philippinarum]|uniref:uncharacterized protein LOC132723290 n=1 Tax=Ruditapes philippinarum TaxID=129788 RepID=UPI00295B0CA4|nr:uncharacterized protein LOC132723290 [Ruditapes philippinarum]
MNPEDRINNPQYLNWIKGTLALMHLCDVVRNYTYHIFDKFLDTISNRRHYNNGSNYKFLADNTKWDSSKWRYTTIYQCVCQSLFREILRLHFFGDKRIGFTNCKDKYVGGPWGLAKFFMPVSKYCADIETPGETEPTIVLKMIQNCRLFDNIAHANIDIIIESRNAMMHSPLNNVNDADLKKYIDAMVDFLRDALKSQIKDNIRQQLNKAQEEIRQLRYADMRVDLLPENAERAINFKKRLVIGSIKREYEEADVAKLGEYLDILDELGGDLLAWNKKSWEIGKLKEIGNYREMLDKALAEKDEAIKSLNETREELDNVKIEFNDTKNKLHEAETKIITIQRELKDTQERLDAITEENKDKQDELNTTKNQLDSATKENERLQDELNDTIEKLDAATEENVRQRNQLKTTHERLDVAIKESNEVYHVCKIFAIISLFVALILVYF